MSAEFRVLLAAIGAGLGRCSSVLRSILEALVGGILVLGAVELNAIRAHVKLVDEEVKRLRQGLQLNQEPVGVVASVQTSRPAPQLSGTGSMLGRSVTLQKCDGT
jgi:hypothetical protein